MAGSNTVIALNSAPYTYLFDLITAARVAAAQQPLQFPYSRRLLMWHDGAANAVRITEDPKGNPAGVAVSNDPTNPTIRQSGVTAANENLRSWYVKGVANVHIAQEY